ncbi:C2H2 finger domain protein [Cenococcum geophilum]
MAPTFNPFNPGPVSLILYPPISLTLHYSLYPFCCLYTISQPKALLNLCYRYIIGGPYNIVLKFTFKFTKEYLSIKEANTFLIPKIIFNPLLILSPYLTKLYIKPRRNQLLLLLYPDLDNIPYLTLLLWIKDLSIITGFRQVTRLYSLRYGVGKAFNKNSNVTNALRNLIM